MSTTDKGNDFESLVARLVQQEIDAGRFPAPPGMATVFRQKTYTSKDRGPIKVDVSVEVTMPGSTKPSLVFIIECKDHKNPIKAEIAQNLWSILDQVAGAKGIIASTAPFQAGTYSFAESKRIALLRVHDRASLKWELPRHASLPGETEMLRKHLHDSVASGAFSQTTWCVGDQYGNDLARVFSAQAPEALQRWLKREPGLLVRHVPKDEIEAVATRLIDNLRHFSGPVPLEEICKKEATASGLRIVRPRIESGDPPTVLGTIRFSPLQIVLFESPSDASSRVRFTLAHELGHFYLDHGRYISKEAFEREDSELNVSAGLIPKELRKLEWQANYFAACLLMPKAQLLSAIDDLADEFDLKDRGHGLLYRDSQACNQRTFKQVTNRLRLQFEVSLTALCLRLTGLGILQEAEDGPASLSTVLRVLL